MDRPLPSAGKTGLEHLQKQVKDLVQRFTDELDCCVEEHLRQLQHRKQCSLPDSFAHPFALPQEEPSPLILPHAPNQEEQQNTFPRSQACREEKEAADAAVPAPDDSDEEELWSLDSPSLDSSGRVSKRSLRRKSTGIENRRKFLVNSPSTLEATLQARSFLKKIVWSNSFEWFGGTLIILNAAFIGIQTEWESVEAQRRASAQLPQLLELPSGFFAVRAMFSILFLLELILRWRVDGCLEFFKGEDAGWNKFDTVIVGLGTIDILTELIVMVLDSQGESPLNNFSVFRLLRLLRIIRVVRIIRVMRFFRELRMMVLSILGCVKSMVWIFIILGVVFYLFGISFVQAVTMHLQTSEDWRDPGNKDLIAYFGTVERAILTLFQAMSGGQDWGVFFDCLLQVSSFHGMLFIFYILFSVFVVVNVVIGVFVDSASQSGKSDKEVVVHEELQNRREYLTNLRELYQALDADDDGVLTKDEFEKCMELEATQAFFNALQLDVRKAARLFDLLDSGHKGSVTIDEFVTGCFDLHGEASTFDAKVMHIEVRYIKESMSLVFDMIKELTLQLTEAQKIVVPAVRSRRKIKTGVVSNLPDAANF